MQIFISDKSGKKFWNTSVNFLYSRGERHNLERHLASIRARHPAYSKCGIDAESAHIGSIMDEWDDIPVNEVSIDEILKELED
jgi:hypothetical protein